MIDLEARAVEQNGLLLHEPAERLLQFDVDVERPVQETRTRTARPVPIDRGLGGLLDLRMIGQAEIAIRAQHQHLPAADDDLTVLCGRDRPKIRIQPQRPNLRRAAEVLHLVEKGK